MRVGIFMALHMGEEGLYAALHYTSTFFLAFLVPSSAFFDGLNATAIAPTSLQQNIESSPARFGLPGWVENGSVGCV